MQFCIDNIMHILKNNGPLFMHHLYSPKYLFGSGIRQWIGDGMSHPASDELFNSRFITVHPEGMG